MGILDFIFGTRKRQIKEFLDQGAVILDVRSQSEWDKGHIKNALHYPLDNLQNTVDELKAMQASFVVCCESGARSSKATEYLNLNNISAINGGGWKSLKSKL